MPMKNIEYSRHARRRMQLYNISNEDVSSIIEQNSLGFAVQQEKNEIISDNIFSESGYPIKIVFTREREKIVIITAYPLKRRAKP